MTASIEICGNIFNCIYDNVLDDVDSILHYIKIKCHRKLSKEELDYIEKCINKNGFKLNGEEIHEKVFVEQYTDNEIQIEYSEYVD